MTRFALAIRCPSFVDAMGNPSPRAVFLSMLLVLALVAAVFGQTWGFGLLLWDDLEYVRDNPRVLQGLTWESWAWALTTFEVGNWHPLTWWSYQLDVTLFGPAPGPMHLVNVVFHGANSLLVGVLLRRWTFSWIPALLGAAVFAVHPLHVESVAWVSERKDVLSAFFLLLSLLAWDSYVRRRRVLQYGLALIFMAVGLMAKSMLVTLPCLLLILDGWPYQRLRLESRPWFKDRQLLDRCIEKLPFAILAGVCAWVAIISQERGGAISSLAVVGFGERLGHAAVAYATYLFKTLVPSSQYFLYLRGHLDPLDVAVSCAALVLLSWWAAKRRGAILTGWLWFLVSLMPVIGLVTIGGHSRADRYMYIPMIGLLVMVAGALPWGRWAGNSGKPHYGKPLALAVCAILVLTVLAYRYTGYWRDSETLLKRALAIDPGHHVAHGHLAMAYERRGQLQLALMHADSALRQPMAAELFADVAVSAGKAATRLGNLALAGTYLENAKRAAPRWAEPYYNLGVVAAKAGDLAAAKTYFEQAIELNGNYTDAYNDLGIVLLQLGEKERAIAAFARALRLDPGNRQAKTNLTLIKGSGPD